MDKTIQETILRGVLSGEKERYYYLSEKVKDEYFTDEFKDLWIIIQRIFDVTRELLDATVLEKVLGRSSLTTERIAKVEDLWGRLAVGGPVTEVDFRSSINLLLEDQKKEQLGTALAKSLEILINGVKDEKKGTIQVGPDDALNHFRQSMADIDDVGSEEMPEFDIRNQKEELLAELDAENSMNRLPTGWVPFDDMTNGGLALGEVCFVVAGTGVGKSISCTNIGHHVMVQGGNVIYFTTETLFTQVRHRTVIRHTRMSQFGIPMGISSTRVKKHTREDPTLRDYEEEAYRAAVVDFTDNPNYGKLIVVQVPRGTTTSSLEAKLYRWHQYCPIDLCIIDSPDMLAPDYRHNEERNNLSEIVNAVKALAIGFDEGRGMRILAPWQASRNGQKVAQEQGRYDKTCLSDTAMAEKRADIIVALLEDQDTPTKLKAQTLKNRDSGVADFELEVNLDTYYIGSDESLNQSEIGDVGGLL